MRVKADLTVPGDAKTQQLTKQYAILGVPTIVLIDSTGTEQSASRLTGFEAKEKFLTRVEAVK